tara:strand:+ start:4626 stop:4913 length:288 start_codon:yes stop_codon:yes gene_type:complete
MKTRVHVNQHVVKANRKNNTNDPVLTVKTYKSNKYAHTVDINGPSKVVYRPEKPLSCGAHVWIEADSADIVCDTDIEVIDQAERQLDLEDYLKDM